MPRQSEHQGYDLHCHSVYSDGVLTPQQLVYRAVERELNYLAITDHDSIAGFAEAEQVIRSEQPQLRLITGVELTCQWQGFEIHLVGLNFDPSSLELQQLLALQQQRRRERFAAMLAKLKHIGFVLELDAMLESATMPTRKHIADALVESGQVSSFDGVFRRYLGKGQQAYIKPEWCDLETAISAVQRAGGKTAIAHPHAYKFSNKWLRRLFSEAKEFGLDAIEVALSQQAPGQRDALAGFAKDLELACSVGSDFHAPRPWRDLGKNLCLPAGCMPIWDLF